MAAGTVWVALAEPGGAYGEVADALRENLPGSAVVSRWEVGTWDQLRTGAAGADAPRLIVTVGLGALRATLADPAGRAPVLALLLPRSGYERALLEARTARQVSAVVLDQPAGRQFSLLRLALPQVRRVGVLAGAEARPQMAAFEVAARSRGLILLAEDTAGQGVGAALQKVLADSEALLALPDGEVINGQTIANILTAGYRQRVPLIGYSPSLVRAGALFGLYSTPQQIAARGADAIREVFSGGRLPGVLVPSQFTVMVNPAVARSFGLVLDGEALAKELRREEGQP